MLAVAVLAAGKGTRMKSDLPKVLQDLGGRSLLSWVLNSARPLAPDRILVIVGFGAEQVQASLSDQPDLEFVLQAQQLGTGHAIQQLLNPLKNFRGELVVLTGDTPLLRASTIANLVEFHRSQRRSATVLTGILPDPTGYGRVFCDDRQKIIEIVEHRDCTPTQRLNSRVSSGVYCFDWAELAIALPKLTNHNAQQEYYLTQVFDYLPEVYALDLADHQESLGINDRLQLAQAYGVLQQRIKQDWMRHGVTMIMPETITIDPEVQLAANVRLEPQTHLRGKTQIGSGSKIGPGSLIENSEIGADCQVLYSVITASSVGDRVKIGPFAHIRGESRVGSDCRLGNYVELKNAHLGSQTNAAHLSYLGDARLGSQVNIGAGTITANFDGKFKHVTTIGDRTKTGSNTVLVAPVSLGNNVNVAAGSVITQSVPDNALAIARAMQVTKPDYYDAQGQKKSE
ncbi:MAG: bifunctional UDP-N-acetylglucosamine diphosphorylase/glucosamine-1-phosphate N-acetyltransferase GlmU [Pseudanabaenaceae cyanobacterium bins.68]|nr:bifunctional UDP-N-acetylglucosamine diphosphorylase/glucosamine-1-phosphate N-acetyltransferase GlmU [Pseudanabaenaceae cyanobacterium bins.68]